MASRKTKKTPGAKARQAAGKRKRSWGRRLALGTLWTFLLGIILACGAFLVAYALIEVPKPDQIAQAQTTTVYYQDGKTVMGTFAEVNRTIVDTTALPSYVGQAVVASEDRTFFSNNGVDLRGIARAFWSNVRGNARQGASTLSQQYVERYYLGQTTGYLGKAKEAILALKINREQPKAIILDNYLNTIYFGRGAYGIESAARAYFGKPAAQLSLSESALLAGIIPAPSKWDPAKDEARAKERWNRTLDLMVTDGWVPAADRAKAEFPKTIVPKKTASMTGTKGYLLQHVRTELEAKAGFTGDEIDQLGLKIVTTIDPKVQDMAVEAAQSLPDSKPANLRVALVAIDPKTGGVIAEYGGPDYQKVQRNAATQDNAMAGSTFKPFALVAGLERGDDLSTTYNGSSPQQIKGSRITNFHGGSYGQVTLERATQMSINTAYVNLNVDVGPETTREVAIRAGYPEKTPGLNTNVANVLGSCSPHTIDIATAFATFADQGVRHETHIVAEVRNPDGAVVHRPDTAGKRVFEPQVMADTTAALESVVKGGSGEKARAVGRPVAAKTGSSQDNRSAQFAGYVPQMAVAVSLYQVGADGSEESITPFGGEREITGSTFPAKIFTTFMRDALDGVPVVSFPPPTKPVRTYATVTETPSEETTTPPTPAPVVPTQPQPDPVTTPPTTAPPKPSGWVTTKPPRPPKPAAG